MIRVVLDTNVLIAAARSPQSASRQIVAACLDGKVKAVISKALQQEYDLILRQALSNVPYVIQLVQWIDTCSHVEPETVFRVVPDDADDDKIVALAIAAQVDALVTSDHHLKCLHPLENISILSPSELLARFPEVQNS